MTKIKTLGIALGGAVAMATPFLASAQMSPTFPGDVVSSTTNATGAALEPVAIAILGLFALLVALGMGLKWFKRFVGRKA